MWALGLHISLVVYMVCGLQHCILLGFGCVYMYYSHRCALCVVSAAKVQPSRYIRAGASLKLLAGSKSTKFYKTPVKSAAGSRRRAVFFLHGASTAQCSCLQAGAGLVDGRAAGDAGDDDGSLLVAGRLVEVGGSGRRRRSRLVVTVVVPFSSQSLVRRAVRLTRNSAVACQRPRPPRAGGRRRRRPDTVVKIALLHWYCLISIVRARRRFRVDS